MYYVYMLRCKDNSIYTGITTDIDRRVKEHLEKAGKCAKYTLNHSVKYLECAWKTQNRVLASKLEYNIKKLTKIKKEELIKCNNLSELLKNKIDEENYIRIK